MLWKLLEKRPYRPIYGVIGSVLCSILWGLMTLKYVVGGKSTLFPLIMFVLFTVCAGGETRNYLRIRRRLSQNGQSKAAQEARKGTCTK